MEPTPRYPLAASALGESVRVNVGELDTETLRANSAPFLDADSTLRTVVELEPDPYSDTWHVRWPIAFGAPIGEIAPYLWSAYEDVDSVAASGYVPSVEAVITLDPIAGDVTVDLLLPPGPLSVPRNNALPGALVAPQGTGRHGEDLLVDVSRGDFTATETMLMSPGQWLVGLALVGGEVVVTCDARVLGTLDPRHNDDVRRRIESLALGATPLMARAFAIDGTLHLDLSSSFVNGVVFELPSIGSSARQTRQPWHVYTYADGTVAVTVEGVTALDPDDQFTPRPGARTVPWLTPTPAPAATPTLASLVSPNLSAAPDPHDGTRTPDEPERRGRHAAPDVVTARPTPDHEDAPTQYFPALPALAGFTPDSDGAVGEEAYLSEVEKVRLRRAKRDGIGRGRVAGAHRMPEDDAPGGAGSGYVGRHRSRG